MDTKPHTENMKGKNRRFRQERIVVLVTPPEKEKFEKMAEERYTNLSELVRQILHREADVRTGS